MQLWYSPDQTQFKIAYFRDNYEDLVDLEIASVFPLSEIEFENEMWPCPKDPETVLKAIYGYIGSPAKFNPITKKYEPLD